MSFGGQIGHHRPNARGSEKEKSLSQEDVTARQVSHDPAIVRQGVRLLAGILTLLLIAFCYFASSVCITVVVATFLAILLDPAVAVLERARIPRFFAAGSIVLFGVLLFGSIAYASYGKLADFFDDFPLYVSRIAETLSPISSKIQRVRDSAGKLANEAEPKKVPEVRIRESTSWASYLARGVGSAWGALLIAGVVPFLTFFLLIARDKIYLSFRSGAGKQMDFDRMIVRANAMIRSYVAGNLVIGTLLSAITALVFWQIGLAPAILLGTVSGMLNLIPFLGIVIALIIPLMAGVFQFHSLTPFAVIVVTVIALHLIAANLLVPRFVGSRLDIGPVAATIGFLFWGWLWGVLGLLLAVPLTAFVKLLADSNPAMSHLSILLAREPQRFLIRAKTATISQGCALGRPTPR
jgi:predicted PurR-regulated permease PerM